MRLDFRNLARSRGFELTLDGLNKMLSGPLDDAIKHYLNKEKTWNDYYRYYILKDETVVDTHMPSDMKEIK
jgi:hypothetical protein